MERLLKDAQKLTGVKYDINNLADVYSAIHAVQEELKITNTTQDEATKTLTGSFTMLKASWDNFLSGSGDIGKVVESAGVAFKNVIRIVEDALPSIMENFYDWLPEIIDLGKEIVGTIVNSVIDNLPMLVSMGAQIVLEIVNGILQNIPLIGENADEITNGIAQVFTSLIDIITTVVTKLSELYDWLTKHQDILTIIIGIIGTLTAAIVAYTIVQNASAIALAVLNGLLGVYNVVTTLATTVSGAFGAIMAFITSPITLVILAIGALVVAIVLLIKHWDEVKEVALRVWEMIKTAVSNAIELVKKKFEEMKAKIIETFNKVILAVTAWISNMKAKAVEGVKNICDRIMSTFRELPNKVKEVGSNIVHGLWNGIMGLKDWVVEKVKGMGSEVINSLKNVLGIHSPSTKFAEIGKNSILGFEKGFIENSRQVFNELASTVESEASKMNNKLGLNSVIERNINLSNTLQTIESDRNINVNANTYLDGRKIATSVDKVNVRDKLAYGIGG